MNNTALQSDHDAVIRRYHQAMLAKDADMLADLYAEDAVHEMPFTHDPRVVMQGREAIREQYKAAWSQTPVVLEEIMNVAIHRMFDGEMAVCEFDFVGRVVPSQSTFTASGVLVMRLRDGLLVHVRDYIDALTIGKALGAAPFSR